MPRFYVFHSQRRWNKKWRPCLYLSFGCQENIGQEKEEQPTEQRVFGDETRNVVTT